MAASAPQTAALLRDRGLRVVEVDISEFEKLEGVRDLSVGTAPLIVNRLPTSWGPCLCHPVMLGSPVAGQRDRRQSVDGHGDGDHDEGGRKQLISVGDLQADQDGSHAGGRRRCDDATRVHPTDEDPLVGREVGVPGAARRRAGARPASRWR